jgi:hypothetical protein
MQVTAKGLKGRDDKMPRLGDIYGSSEPEFVTDNLLFVARPDAFVDDPREHTHTLRVGYSKCRKRRRDLPASRQFLLDRYGQVKDLHPEKEEEIGFWMD